MPCIADPVTGDPVSGDPVSGDPVQPARIKNVRSEVTALTLRIDGPSSIV